MKKVEVVAGIIMYGDEILCLQRGECKQESVAYKFEFPGGKIEQGETNIQTLKRELKEELDMTVNVNEDDFFTTVNYQYPEVSLTMHTYKCKAISKEFVMNVHNDFKWITVDKLNELDWSAADKVIVDKLVGAS